MGDGECARKLDELERLLNDPDEPLQPGLIWRLLDEVMEHDSPDGVKRSDRQ